MVEERGDGGMEEEGTNTKTCVKQAISIHTHKNKNKSPPHAQTYTQNHVWQAGGDGG
jgi:hypothetical protein